MLVQFAFDVQMRCPFHGFEPCVRACTGCVLDCPFFPDSADGQGPAAARKGDDAPAAVAPGAVAGHCIPPQVDSDGPAFPSARHLTCADFYTADIEAREDLQCRP